MNNSIKEWLSQAKKSGQTNSQITEQLLQQGWNKQRIKDLLGNQTSKVKQKPTLEQTNHSVESNNVKSYFINKGGIIALTVIYVLFNLSQSRMSIIWSVLTAVRYNNFLGEPTSFIIAIILLFGSFYLFNKWYAKLIGYMVGIGILSTWLIFTLQTLQGEDMGALFVIYYYAISALIFFPLIFFLEKAVNKLLRWKWGVFIMLGIALLLIANVVYVYYKEYKSDYERTHKIEVIEDAFIEEDKRKTYSNCDDLENSRVRNECLTKYATEFKDPEACNVVDGIGGAESGKYFLANVYDCLVESSSYLSVEQLCGYFSDEFYISCVLEYASEKKNLEACKLLDKDTPEPQYDNQIALNLANIVRNDFIETANDQCIMNIVFDEDKNYNFTESDLDLCGQFNNPQVCRFWIYKWLASKNHDEKYCNYMLREGLPKEDILYGCTKDIKSYYQDQAKATLSDEWCDKAFELNKLDGCDVECFHDAKQCVKILLLELIEKAEETGSVEYCDKVTEYYNKYTKSPYKNWWDPREYYLEQCEELGF